MVLLMPRPKKEVQIREGEVGREEDIPEGYWTYFAGERAQASDCLRCMEEVKESGRPSALAMNCWKLLAFPSTSEKLSSIKDYLLSMLRDFLQPTENGQTAKVEEGM